LYDRATRARGPLAGADKNSQVEKDRITRIMSGQVLCKLGCGQAACFLLYEYSGKTTPVVSPYCEDHVKPISMELKIKIPD
jgi:hypothetical protein